MPVMASEYHSLTDDERKQIFDITTKVIDNRVPAVAGITGVSNAHSSGLAVHAQDAGFDSVIAMPPHSMKPSVFDILVLFEQLIDALDIPIFIQRHVVGAPPSAPHIVGLRQQIGTVRHPN